jgi:hypothetical protein
MMTPVKQPTAMAMTNTVIEAIFPPRLDVDLGAADGTIARAPAQTAYPGDV